MSDTGQLPGFDELPEEPPLEEEPKKKRKGGVLLLLVAIILVLAGIGGVVWSVWPQFNPPPNAMRDMRGNVVIPDEDAVVDDPSAKADVGLRFKAPSVNLDVPLGEAREVNGQIAPPGFTSVYRITNLGVTLDKATKGTVYTATHSLRNGGWAPGNALIDIDSQEAKVSPGDKLIVGDRTYSVTETRIIPKPKVASVGDLWDAKVKGRLIVFTCLQNPQNTPSTNNVVIIGTLDE